MAMLLFLATGAVADSPNQSPPATPKRTVTEEFHGTKIIDDYRWLEKADDPAVGAWIEEQNLHTRAVIDQYKGLPAIRERLKQVIGAASADYLELQYAGGKLLAKKMQPPKEQPLLIVLKSPDDPQSERVVLDPNTLNKTGTTTIDWYVPSLDGNLVAVSLSESGSENGTLHIYEVQTGKKLPDVIAGVQYATAGGSAAWNADGSGIYYTRYPREGERPKQDQQFYQQVYFHKLGTPSSEDTYKIGQEFPRIAETKLRTSRDGRFVLAEVANGDGGEYSHYLLNPGGKWTQLTHFSDKVTSASFGRDEALYLLSFNSAPRGQILRVPLSTPALSHAQTIVPESRFVIQSFQACATCLYVVVMDGGPSQLHVFTIDGRMGNPVPILAVSSIDDSVAGRDDEILFRNESYIKPPAWYRFDPASGKVARTALGLSLPADFSDAEVIREFATSKDGTKVPLNIIMRKGTKLDGQNPTLLTGYGGFNISETPNFRASRRIWLDQGGIYVVANLRGGGEYGEEWHKAGNLTKKQNVFDDFAACAQQLIQRKYTESARLAIEGGSNGGLLMGAALTQHPHLFAAVVCRVGVLDMFLHDRHPNGEFNTPEYGTVKDPEQFKAIYAYSPYQHVKNGTAYPAVLFLTGAQDGRVDPANSLKMAARLQAATSSKRPILLKVNSGTGHGAGTALSKAIEQQADVYAFLFQQLGIEYRPAKR
jgi:prolyl oligopeptidase